MVCGSRVLYCIMISFCPLVVCLVVNMHSLIFDPTHGEISVVQFHQLIIAITRVPE